MKSDESMRFADFAAMNPHAIAIVDPVGHEWSRQVVVERVNKLSRALVSKGVRPGDVMAIVAPNCADFLIAYLAGTQIGLFVVPVNWHLAPGEIRYILEDCRARVLIAHGRCRDLMANVLPWQGGDDAASISIHSDIPGFVPVEQFSEGFDGQPLESVVHGRRLSYTSATTGRPKGVVRAIELAQWALELSIGKRLAAGAQQQEHVQLCASMLYHGAPLEGVVIGLHMGQTVVLVDRATPESLLQVIHERKVTLAYIVPATFRQLLGLDDATKRLYSTASIRRVIHTGAACPVDVKREMIQWWGPILWEAYGATEGSGTLASSADWLKYPGTVGRAMPGTKIRIVGDDGRQLPSGQIGKIYLTHHTGEPFHYLGDQNKTLESHAGEYFTVGDIGFQNEEGYLFLSDRENDMINLGGVKVYSSEIECVLLRSPHVADCAVFGVPDIKFGEMIVAAVQLAAPASGNENPKAALVRFLLEHIAFHKIPRDFYFTEDLDREATGKLKKRKLRERYLREVESRVGRNRRPAETQHDAG